MEAKNQKTRKEMRQGMKLYTSLARPYAWLFVIVIVVALLISGARMAEKYVFKVLIDEGTAFSAGTLSSEAFLSIIVVLVGVFLGSVLVHALGGWFKHHFIIWLDSNLVFDLKKKFFDHLVHLSHRFHTTHKTGSLISRLGRGSRAVEGITDFVSFDIFPLIIEALVVGSAILYFDALSAGVALGVMVLFTSWSLFVLDKQQPSRLKANEADDREKAVVADVFTNIESVKYFGKEHRVKAFFARLAEITKKRLKKNWHYLRYLEAGQTLILGVGTVLLLYLPFMKFLDGGLSMGSLVFIYTVYGNLTGPLFGFVYGVRRFYEGMADLYDLAEYEGETNDIVDREDAKVMKVRAGAVAFENVDFVYHKDRKVIRKLNLDIAPGEKIALVGHSGSGKTTIVKLLYRLYDVSGGAIKVDGVDIRNVQQESLRSELSIVPQEAILFDDTIYNNIQFSNPKASRRDVLRAIKFAQLDRFVRGLPKGLNTIVGERGVKLSGGEKQRVSIARALLADKKILVLDEATSALDSQTESEIQRDLEQLMEGRTSIIIAHRLSTIMHADRIVVMDRGRIVQVGSHRELIRQKGRYKELWDLQKGGYL